ncbi:MAG: Holliday junction branch migration protein RuvA [Clostridiaceae bacterium]|nr:Holliday junction branch migration protein RuvA [Clostridiaceae bacterium]
MYAYIRGTIVSRQADCLVIDNRGIGYRILAAPGLMDRFPAKGETALIHTYLYIREDVQALYGFPKEEDLKMFELLLTVSGIGPKVASTIVGALSPSQFALAVITGDTKTLTQIRGIGRKGAERLILELKDKLKGAEMPESAIPAGDWTAAPDARSNQTEAVSALMVLGYHGTEAAEAVAAVFDANRSLEELIKLALRQLMR